MGRVVGPVPVRAGDQDGRTILARPRRTRPRGAARGEGALKYPPVQFSGVQARAVARGFAKYLRRLGIQVWACSIMPDHVHLVVRKLPMSVEQLVIQLNGAATRQLEEEGVHPLARYKEPGKRVPQCWVRGQWKVFLDPEDVPRAIEYVRDNPVKEGKKQQSWSFVTPFDGF